MNRYPIWKYILILVIVIFGFIYALPNIYAPDPAIQVSGHSAALTIDDAVLKKVEQALDEAGIKHFGGELSETNVTVRLYSQDDQLVAQSKVQEFLSEDYVVAVNLAPTTPDWLLSIGAEPMKLGLDLAGGVHFLLEVDTQKILQDDLKSIERLFKTEVRKANIRGVHIDREGMGLRITVDSDEKRTQITEILRDSVPEMDYVKLEEEGKFIALANFKGSYISEKEDYAVTQNLTTLRNRVNEIGVSEPLVQRQGRNRIVVELPGIQDTARAKSILGKTANLEFRLEATPEALSTQKELFSFKNEDEQARFGGAYLEKRPIVKGDSVTNAQLGYDQDTGLPQVNITLDGNGGTKMHRSTRNNVGRRMGILFIEYKTRTNVSTDENGEEVRTFTQIPTEKIISLATVRSALGKSFVITGLDSPQEASELALLLRAGALAAPMGFVEERTVGPSLGAENIKMGVDSVKIGLGLVLLFMLVYYRVFGFAANIALVANLFILVAIMSAVGATLTLPGIAGIVLTVGMAVDANVLIFSRIREEMKNGAPNQTAIKSGFDRAFVTILDANITTLIVAAILFAIGTGPIKGFAVTLSIGIVTSMFTAIMGSRAIVNLIYGGRNVKKLWI
ncbi:protein translocase subunit SecD [Teredinibacter sp. KSP-S5-2]|uniref:protein translocase subunit SecD n=1 Tax=Teredinibacter sp. KSP-S5-2 TaxID=3034506 RepID=UPI0029349ED9|nr:protein translocase subunit SecD [Teredinibacter sp. KSP-S5-2]WNO11192.1 protein translocase subunit SecD [Teredinibacter sp. KSP-S5-2]